MKVVDCEHLFGGERVVFYFLPKQRVDFRELVHRLATRVSNPHRNAAGRGAR